VKLEFGRLQDRAVEKFREFKAGIAGVIKNEKYTVLEVGSFQESIRTIVRGLL
jgi:hypothetical protein